jgi:hypothetical protein
MTHRREGADEARVVHDLADGRRAEFDLDESAPRFDSYLDGGAMDGELVALPDQPELWVEITERSPDGSWQIVGSERYRQVAEPDDVEQAGGIAGADTVHRVFRVDATRDDRQ